jgi:hypothetical protein
MDGGLGTRLIVLVLRVAQVVPEFWAGKIYGFFAKNEKSAHIDSSAQ